jgi:SAM-dependent methyltransferase
MQFHRFVTVTHRHSNAKIVRFGSRFGTAAAEGAQMKWHDYINNLGPEVRKTYQSRIESGFFDRFLSGEHILDIGYKGRNLNAVPIVPHATGVDRDYPGYDGVRLPFADATQDAVHSSHCLEHLPDYRAAIAEWFRVLKIGGYLVLTVPHRWLYERKPTPTSRFGGNQHLRFYTVGSLAAEIEASLPPGNYRIRVLRDNDDNFDYSIPPELHAEGCYEIELVLQKIALPAYAGNLELSPKAKTIIAVYAALIQSMLADAKAAAFDSATLAAFDSATLAAFGREFPIPPYPVITQLFPLVPDTQMRKLLWPMVDPTVVDPDWYLSVHSDVMKGVASGKIKDIGNHFRRAGYFECKLPRKVDPIYG